MVFPLNGVSNNNRGATGISGTGRLSAASQRCTTIHLKSRANAVLVVQEASNGTKIAKCSLSGAGSGRKPFGICI